MARIPVYEGGLRLAPLSIPRADPGAMAQVAAMPFQAIAKASESVSKLIERQQRAEEAELVLGAAEEAERTWSLGPQGILDRYQQGRDADGQPLVMSVLSEYGTYEEAVLASVPEGAARDQLASRLADLRERLLHNAIAAEASFRVGKRRKAVWGRLDSIRAGLKAGQMTLTEAQAALGRDRPLAGAALGEDGLAAWDEDVALLPRLSAERLVELDPQSVLDATGSRADPLASLDAEERDALLDRARETVDEAARTVRFEAFDGRLSRKAAAAAAKRRTALAAQADALDRWIDGGTVPLDLPDNEAIDAHFDRLWQRWIGAAPGEGLADRALDYADRAGRTPTALTAWVLGAASPGAAVNGEQLKTAAALALRRDRPLAPLPVADQARLIMAGRLTKVGLDASAALAAADRLRRIRWTRAVSACGLSGSRGRASRPSSSTTVGGWSGAFRREGRMGKDERCRPIFSPASQTSSPRRLLRAGTSRRRASWPMRACGHAGPRRSSWTTLGRSRLRPRRSTAAGGTSATAHGCAAT